MSDPLIDQSFATLEGLFVAVGFLSQELDPIHVALFVFIATRTSGNSIAKMIEAAIVDRLQMVGVPACGKRVFAIAALAPEEFSHRKTIFLADVLLKRRPKHASRNIFYPSRMKRHFAILAQSERIAKSQAKTRFFPFIVRFLNIHFDSNRQTPLISEKSPELVNIRRREMISKFFARKLNGSIDCDLEFNADLNLITGKNGSGKTTIMKVIWYLMSGNLERIVPEVTFDEIFLSSENFDIGMRKVGNVKAKRASEVIVEWRIGKEKHDQTFPIREVDNLRSAATMDPINVQIIAESGSSIFFPTFRRIEGGFSIDGETAKHRRVDSLHAAMNDLSRQLTVMSHAFVASISTRDIIDLLTMKYAEVSEKTNSSHSELSKFITSIIEKYQSAKKIKSKKTKSLGKGLQEAEKVLGSIERRVEKSGKARERLFLPFTVLSELIAKVFRDKGIEISEAITLGETLDTISSEKLSAGEKQMLSFLCYNAFYENAVIFIDEPEISLHVDWQRSLFPTLLSQETGNQFIIATHSPFIYSKYTDKEICLGERGD